MVLDYTSFGQKKEESTILWDISRKHSNLSVLWKELKEECKPLQPKDAFTETENIRFYGE